MALLKARVHQTYISANPMVNVLNVSTILSAQNLAINVWTEFVSVGTYRHRVIQLAVVYVTQMMAMESACVVNKPNATQLFKI